MKGSRAAQSLVTGSMSQSWTLFPFLYRTRTLAGRQSLHSASSSSLKLQQDHYWRCLHSSIPCRSENSSSQSNTLPLPVRKVPAKLKWDVRIRRLPVDLPWDRTVGGRKRGRPRKQTKALEDVPFEDELQNSQPAGATFTATSDNIPFEDVQNIDGIGSGGRSAKHFGEGFNEAADTSPRSGRESTITISERAAFQRIFADIASRSQSKSDATPSNPPIRKVATTTSKDLLAALQNFPRPLREVAAQAIGVAGESRTAEDTDGQAQEEIDEAEAELEKIQKPERERIEALLRGAKTDIELWSMMENEVFSLVSKLGFAEKPTSADETGTKGKKPRGRKSKKLDTGADDAATSTERQAGEQSRNLALHAPLYPSLLLTSLHLLATSFTHPSPLIHNLLPSIKSLGLISHVLGASTPLYNALIRVYWERFDDLRGVERLLTEMEGVGLAWDGETGDVLDEMLQARQRSDGQAVKALFEMAEFETGKLKEWRERIEASLEGRDSGEVV